VVLQVTTNCPRCGSELPPLQGVREAFCVRCYLPVNTGYDALLREICKGPVLYPKKKVVQFPEYVLEILSVVLVMAVSMLVLLGIFGWRFR
jgi:hypothetical protein